MGDTNVAQSKQKNAAAESPIANALDQFRLLGDHGDIFTEPNLSQTALHIIEQAGRTLYLLTEDEQEIVQLLVDSFKADALLNGDQPSYLTTDSDGNSLFISKATDLLSTDYKESYNHAVLKVGGLTIDWYFVLGDNYETTAGETYHNEVSAVPPKWEILYEYNESNKNKTEFNNTGYRFYRSDGKPLSNTKVTQFIRQKKKEGDPRFIRDFPFHPEKGAAYPTYEVTGSQYTYYEYNFDLDPLNDSHNLKSDLLKGNTNLEATYDGSLTLSKVSSGASGISLLREGLNSYFAANPVLVQMPPGSAYDEQLADRVRVFQERSKLPADGKVGDATIEALDEWLFANQPAKNTNTTTTTKERYDHEKDEFSLSTLVNECTNLAKAVANKDEKELIYSIAEILYQLKLLYNESNDASSTAKETQIGIAKALLIPIKEAAMLWLPADKDEYGWYDLMMIWFFELGPPELEITNKESVTITDLRKHVGVNTVRDKALDLIKTEKEIGEEEYEVEFAEPWNYRLDTMKKNLKEMESLDPGKVNSLELFMGTYYTRVKVVKKKGEEAKMYFTITNESHWESATRFRRERNEGEGQEGIIYDVPRGQGVGLGGDFKVVFKWEE